MSDADPSADVEQGLQQIGNTNWKCKSLIEGGVRCTHASLDTVISLRLDGVTGVVEVPTWADDYEVDLDMDVPAAEDLDF